MATAPHDSAKPATKAFNRRMVCEGFPLHDSTEFTFKIDTLEA
ncbi:hypothetical protein [Pseudomonas gingeri]|nr:hypothetical protein [Pseudomonas gingeri]